MKKKEKTQMADTRHVGGMGDERERCALRRRLRRVRGRHDADSAVLVAAKQKAALQEHAKMQWLACFDSALSAAEVGLERVGVDAD